MVMKCYLKLCGNVFVSNLAKRWVKMKDSGMKSNISIVVINSIIIVYLYAIAEWGYMYEDHVSDISLFIG